MNHFILGVAILIALQLSQPFLGKHKNSSETTYTKDAKPIIEKRCSQCHNGNWPDKNWMDYKTAFKFRDKIKFRVQNETMPPGNSTEMTKEERRTLIKWVDDGGKQ